MAAMKSLFNKLMAMIAAEEMQKQGIKSEIVLTLFKKFCKEAS